MSQDKEVIVSDDPLTKTIVKITNYLYRQYGWKGGNQGSKEIERIIREDHKAMGNHDYEENAKRQTNQDIKVQAQSGQGRPRHGSPQFYKLLEVMAQLHDKKSHDYADDKDPFGNYYFAGRMSKLFKNPSDAGFFGRLAEKIYRLANLENSSKTALNEGVDDTEMDICVITTLWMASRVQRRLDATKLDESYRQQLREGTWEGFPETSSQSLLQPLDKHATLGLSYVCAQCHVPFGGPSVISLTVKGHDTWPIYFCSLGHKELYIHSQLAKVGTSYNKALDRLEYA